MAMKKDELLTFMDIIVELLFCDVADGNHYYSSTLLLCLASIFQFAKLPDLILIDCKFKRLKLLVCTPLPFHPNSPHYLLCDVESVQNLDSVC
jgi:hypothetical protein